MMIEIEKENDIMSMINIQKKEKRKESYTKYNRSCKGLDACKRYRKNHPTTDSSYYKSGKHYEEQKKRLSKSRETAINSKQEYTIKEIELIMKKEHTESELAKMLGRSIKAINQKRYWLTHQRYR